MSDSDSTAAVQPIETNPTNAPEAAVVEAVKPVDAAPAPAPAPEPAAVPVPVVVTSEEKNSTESTPVDAAPVSTGSKITRNYAVLPPEPHAVHHLVAIHNSFRHDFYEMADKTASLTVDTCTVELSKQLNDWYNHFEHALTHHHQFEDKFFFPEFNKRIGSERVTAIFSELESEHKIVHAAQLDIESGFKVLINPDTTTDQRRESLEILQKEFNKLAILLNRHFGIEEELWSVEILKAVTLKEQHKLTGDLIKNGGQPMSELLPLFAYMTAHCNKKDTRDCLSVVPFFVRWYITGRVFPKYWKSAPKLYKEAHGFQNRKK